MKREYYGKITLNFSNLRQGRSFFSSFWHTAAETPSFPAIGNCEPAEKRVATREYVIISEDNMMELIEARVSTRPQTPLMTMVTHGH